MYKPIVYKLMVLGLFFLSQGTVIAKTPPLHSCENDSACSTNQQCAQDLISEKKYCFKKCTSSSDCPLLWYCHPQLNLCQHFCTGSEDCPENYLCTHELSEKEAKYPLCLKQCQSESDCTAPLYCNGKSKVCQKYCETDTDCPDGKICHKKKKKCKAA